LDSESEGDAVIPLLERMASDFPQALRYPWRISQEALFSEEESDDSGDSKAGAGASSRASTGSASPATTSRQHKVAATRVRTATLNLKLHHPTTDAFVEALHGLQVCTFVFVLLLRSLFGHRCASVHSCGQTY